MNLNCVMAISGLAPTPDENGLIDLNQKIRPVVPQGTDFYNKHWQDNVLDTVKQYETITLIGHSNGGTKAWETAGDLGKLGKKVKCLLLLEPVPYWWWVWGKYVIPPNVGNALNIRKAWFLPPSCGIVNDSDSYKNLVINTWDHANFCRRPDVQSAALNFINAVYR